MTGCPCGQGCPPSQGPPTTDCQTQVSKMATPCQHDQVYELCVYSPGLHDGHPQRWSALRCCAPCTATLRTWMHGPGATRQVRAVRQIATQPATEETP